MKKKVVFWTVMVLVNAIVGLISVRTYQRLDARISGVEISNKSYYEKLSRWESDNKKVNDNLLGIFGIDGNYDFNGNLIKAQDLNNFFDYKVYARISLVVENPEELMELNPDLSKKSVKINEAPAIVIGQYVLMASHVSDAEFLRRQTERANPLIGVFEQIFELKVLEYKAELLAPDGAKYPLKEIYRNREKDFSLFKLAENSKTPGFPFEIGKSDELRIGNFIYINGWPGFRSEVARQGHITSLTSAMPISEFEVKKDDNEFSISQSTDRGDSGSPVMAFRDGRPELVGIYLGWIGFAGDNGKNTRSRALKINAAIDEIKEKTKIDLRKLQHNLYEEKKSK